MNTHEYAWLLMITNMNTHEYAWLLMIRIDFVMISRDFFEKSQGLHEIPSQMNIFLGDIFNNVKWFSFFVC